jgi:D-sedoheptulose 7-phosphate isomerase
MHSEQSFSRNFLEVTKQIIDQIDCNQIENLVEEILKIKNSEGRLFICGVGGSAGHASHAVNDFRKLARIECYSPTDNTSELTARTNDEGWETVFEEFLKVSRLNQKDAILIFSVGGGSVKPPVSVGLINAVDYAKRLGAKVLGIVGRNGGHTFANGDCVILVPTIDTNLTTPQVEGLTAVIWHLIISHPKIKVMPTKW